MSSLLTAIMGLLLAQGLNDPLGIMIRAYPQNVYPIVAMLMVFLVITFQMDFGPMAKAERRARREGKVLADNATPMISSDVIALPTKEGIEPRARNMIVPISTMVLMMPMGLVYSGWSQVEDIGSLNWRAALFEAIGSGSGSTAVLWAVVSALLIGGIMYRTQSLFKLPELVELTFKGIGGVLPLALLMMLAFAVGKVCRDLGTGVFVAELFKNWLSPRFVPLVVFVVSCSIAFSTGTSWGPLQL